jgi:hypothetical protein
VLLIFADGLLQRKLCPGERFLAILRGHSCVLIDVAFSEKTTWKRLTEMSLTQALGIEGWTMLQKSRSAEKADRGTYPAEVHRI